MKFSFHNCSLWVLLSLVSEKFLGQTGFSSSSPKNKPNQFDFTQWKEPLWVSDSNIIHNNANIWAFCSSERARRDQVRNTCLCGGKTGSLCFLPALITYSNWHSTTGCEFSGLDSSAWKAAFHPISPQCWVLGVFTVTQLCRFCLSCSSYRRYLSPATRKRSSFSVFTGGGPCYLW